MMFGVFLWLAALPAGLVFAAGNLALRSSRAADRGRRWPLFLAAAAVVLGLPLAAYARQFSTGRYGLFLLLVLPAQVGVLALLVLHWRALRPLWQTKKALLAGLLVGLAIEFGLTFAGEPSLLLVLIVPPLFMAGLWTWGGRLSRGWLVTWSAILIALLVAEALGGLGNHYVHTTPWLWRAYQLGLGVGSLLPAGFAVLLLGRGWRAWREEEAHSPVLFLGVGALLVLALLLAEFRHGVLTNATARAAEDHMPVGGVAFTILAGMLLAGRPGSGLVRPGLAFSLAVPALIVGAYSLGWQLDPQAITESRAARLQAAVFAYRQEHGAYPADLGELTPVPLPVLFGPLTGRGQVWCYQATADHYRLGYAVFQRYYAPTYPTPYYEIRLVGSQGEPPAGPWMCDAELARLRETGGL